MFAAVLSTPGTCKAVMLILKNAHRHRNTYMTTGSLDEPLLMASTKFLLSHLNLREIFGRRGPQMAQLRTISTISFAIIPILNHSADYFK